MSSLGKAILISGIIALAFAGAFFSVSPVLAENAEEPGLISAGIKDDQALVASPMSQREVAIKADQISDTQLTSDQNQASRTHFEGAESAKDGRRSSNARSNFSALKRFVDSVSTGSKAVTGIYVSEGFALNVGQQPSGSPGYVSGNSGEVTQFGLAADYGSKGFLAHNYLSGESFFDLSVGMKLTLVYGDGSTEGYLIEEIRQFEALQPNSPYSNFVDLDLGGKLSATNLFHSIYNGNNPVVLQTCIANHGISTWGRLFIIAVPVTG